MRASNTTAATLLLLIACSSRSADGPTPSPDGRWILRVGRHDGTLVRLEVARRGDGRGPELIDTRDTDAMKWVAGWSRASDLLYYGSDTGTAIARRFDGTDWRAVPFTDDLCGQLEALFVAKYGRGGTQCTPGE